MRRSGGSHPLRTSGRRDLPIAGSDQASLFLHAARCVNEAHQFAHGNSSPLVTMPVDTYFNMLPQHVVGRSSFLCSNTRRDRSKTPPNCPQKNCSPQRMPRATRRFPPLLRSTTSPRWNPLPHRGSAPTHPQCSSGLPPSPWRRSSSSAFALRRSIQTRSPSSPVRSLWDSSWEG